MDTTNGIPEDVPGLWVHRAYWELPWSRVSFGSESVLYPTGEFLLNCPPHKHAAALEGTIDDQIQHVAQSFEDGLKLSLERFAQIRAHTPGSPAEAAEIQRIKDEVEHEVRTERACFIELDAGAVCTLQTLWRGNPVRFERKVSGVLTYEDPEIRRKAAQGFGGYAERAGEPFRASEKGLFLGNQVAQLLDDQDASVRRAAAEAVYQFVGQPIPSEAADTDLISQARALWTGRQVQ